MRKTKLGCTILEGHDIADLPLVSQNAEILEAEIEKKVDKVAGKGLSTNDFTTTEKNKLAGIEEGANKTTINNTLTSTSTVQALSAKQGKTLKDELGEHKAEMTQLIKIKKDITILATGWIDDTANSGFWIYDIRDEDITADTIVDVNIHLADLEKAESIKSANISSNGKVTIFADEQPTENILCDLKLIRQVS